MIGYYCCVCVGGLVYGDGRSLLSRRQEVVCPFQTLVDLPDNVYSTTVCWRCVAFADASAVGGASITMPEVATTPWSAEILCTQTESNSSFVGFIHTVSGIDGR